VLGSLLIDQNELSNLAGLSVNDFHRVDHRIIFEAVKKLSTELTPVDVVTVAECLERQGNLEKAGGIIYLAALFENTACSANAATYADIVKKRSKMRALQNICESTLKIIGEPAGKTVDEIIGITSSKLNNLFPTFDNAQSEIIVSDVHEFMAKELPARDPILTPWMLKQSLSMIHSWRGTGKTHLSLGIAYAVASGGKFLTWVAPAPRKVLFIDGEMPAYALQERLAAIIKGSDKTPEPGMLQIITPDLQSDFMSDLATPDGQGVIDAILDQDTDLIILDNLSSLVRSGGRENEAESWLSTASWALNKRRQGKSVLFIHHSGKDGKQRGTSRREDQLDVVISLKRPPDYIPGDGACFEVHYEKARHLFGEETAAFEARLTTDDHGIQLWTTRPVEESNLDRIADLLNEGLSQKEVADELRLHKSTVSRAARKAKDKGLIT